MLDLENTSRFFLPRSPFLSVYARALYFRAERASITGGAAERMEVLPRVSKKQPRSRSEATTDSRGAGEEQGGAERANAYTIATAHLHYHGNGVYSHQRPHPDAA